MSCFVNIRKELIQTPFAFSKISKYDYRNNNFALNIAYIWEKLIKDAHPERFY